jgi:hypothetical protein
MHQWFIFASCVGFGRLSIILEGKLHLCFHHVCACVIRKKSVTNLGTFMKGIMKIMPLEISFNFLPSIMATTLLVVRTADVGSTLMTLNVRF